MTSTERSEKQSAWQRKNGAFYTPAATARRMARLLRLQGPATIVDPACGRGDLLSAVAEFYKTSKNKFVGSHLRARILDMGLTLASFGIANAAPIGWFTSTLFNRSIILCSNPSELLRRVSILPSDLSERERHASVTLPSPFTHPGGQALGARMGHA